MPPDNISSYGPPGWLVADRIKAERKRLGLTQSRAAELLGIARNTYKNLETSANPQLSTFFALVELVGMDFRRLVPELVDPEGARRVAETAE